MSRVLPARCETHLAMNGKVRGSVVQGAGETRLENEVGKVPNAVPQATGETRIIF